MELTGTLKGIFTEIAKALKGSDRRLFMARIVKALGKGGQRRAEAELDWNRRTVKSLLRPSARLARPSKQPDCTFV